LSSQYSEAEEPFSLDVHHSWLQGVLRNAYEAQLLAECGQDPTPSV
jgi:hypothetical protein